MSRISKNPEERRDEIINAAQNLFIEKGFAKTKVSDIVKKINVSQGVFYYYFSSKEDIIDEIVDRYMKLLIESSAAVGKCGDLSGTEKLKRMSECQLNINTMENNRIHAIKGVDIHERILKRLILDYVPLMNESFKKEGGKEMRYLMELFVSAANILFDPGIFQWDKKERNDRIEFFIRFMEQSFAVNKGDFSFYKDLMGYGK